MRNRYEEATLRRNVLEDQLQEHKPVADVDDVLICVECSWAAPCDKALELMKQIQKTRMVQLQINDGIRRR